MVSALGRQEWLANRLIPPLFEASMIVRSSSAEPKRLVERNKYLGHAFLRLALRSATDGRIFHQGFQRELNPLDIEKREKPATMNVR